MRTASPKGRKRKSRYEWDRVASRSRLPFADWRAVFVYADREPSRAVESHKRPHRREIQVVGPCPWLSNKRVFTVVGALNLALLVGSSLSSIGPRLGGGFLRVVRRGTIRP